MNAIDKENISLTNIQINSKPRSKFNSLIKSAEKELRVNEDSRVAHAIQKSDFDSLSREWVQEITDKKVSRDLQIEIEKEEKEKEKERIKKGEEEAVRVAIEERRRVKQLEENKKILAANDEKYAREYIMNEFEKDAETKELCSKDRELAEQYEKILQDELIAEEIQLKEKEEYERYLKIKSESIEADRKFALDRESEFYKQALEEKEILRQADFEAARKEQEKLNAQFYIDKADALKKDKEIALKLNIQMEREDHRKEKRLAVIKSSVNLTDLKSIIQIWETTDAEVEDIAGGICITILLPFMQNISLKITGRKRNKIELLVKRTIFREENIDETVNSGSFNAEFILDGYDNIKDKDISYDYSSECGLLHIYIDNLMLNVMDEKKKSNLIKSMKQNIVRFFGFGKK